MNECSSHVPKGGWKKALPSITLFFIAIEMGFAWWAAHVHAVAADGSHLVQLCDHQCDFQPLPVQSGDATLEAQGAACVTAAWGAGAARSCLRAELLGEIQARIPAVTSAL